MEVCCSFLLLAPVNLWSITLIEGTWTFFSKGISLGQHVTSSGVPHMHFVHRQESSMLQRWRSGGIVKG